MRGEELFDYSAEKVDKRTIDRVLAQRRLYLHLRGENIAMKDRKRREEARERAENYAPRPVTSVLMYGVVGVCLAGVAWLAFSRFYDLELFAHPGWMALIFLLVFVGSIALRLLRSRRHASAHRHEYDKGAPR